jgi:hypothetical protein
LELEKRDADKFSGEISKKITEESHDLKMPHEISKRDTEDAGSPLSSENVGTVSEVSPEFRT